MKRRVTVVLLLFLIVNLAIFIVANRFSSEPPVVSNQQSDVVVEAVPLEPAQASVVDALAPTFLLSESSDFLVLPAVLIQSVVFDDAPVTFPVGPPEFRLPPDSAEEISP